METFAIVYPEDELSPEEMEQVEKSLNSGLSTMEELREILRKGD